MLLTGSTPVPCSVFGAPLLGPQSAVLWTVGRHCPLWRMDCQEIARVVLFLVALVRQPHVMKVSPPAVVNHSGYELLVLPPLLLVGPWWCRPETALIVSHNPTLRF